MIGTKIKTLRESQGQKRSFLAEQLGIDETTLYQIEQDQETICVQNLTRIAKALGVSITEFFDEEDLKPNLGQGGPEALERHLLRSVYIDFIHNQKELASQQIEKLIEQNGHLIQLVEQCRQTNMRLAEALYRKTK